MQNEVNVIINSAASVDFNNPLPFALRDNFYSPLRVLAFAKKCKQLSIFVQVSTAYVNSYKEYTTHILFLVEDISKKLLALRHLI